ncbi:biopolymer transporter ExbD [Aquicoccus porphyridii]|uniref:Biopolymer transporter ExbD n=1 Tax=Aquicoccus porphyridii TaxID=1852029 RepID=A0A5A9YXK7_9RHOB|nr:biopolymer transporter ExbD [Aquicoccus porphyridii]KAA0909634.1 biopolymer transporter ExbD [Aquicoccus porphyridii]RAI54478.1 biopolymer transporter ExbD [Rhodobacteraceae bacterium AsT-22]
MLLAPPPARRKPSLTPMIDVVFLLLVFFMLAARFGQDVEIDLPLAAASDQPYEGPPRLVDIHPGGLRLNGIETDMAALLPELGTMMLSHSDAIVLRPRDKADLQRVVEVIETLSNAGYQTLVLVE